MIELVNGAIYNVEADSELPMGILREFYADGHKDDLVCVSKASGEKIYLNSGSVADNVIDTDCQVLLQEGIFPKLYQNRQIYRGGVCILDALGNPVAIARYFPGFYKHFYQCDEKMIDTTVFDLYECLCLCDVNEYSVLIYQQCLNRYQGKVILFGEDWELFLPYLGNAPKDLRMVVTADEAILSRETKDCKTMYLKNFYSTVERHMERCRAGIFSYDEVMMLLYCFTRHKSFGGDYPGKKFFVMDGRFGFFGLLAMCSRLSAAYSYIASKEYIPIISIVSSDTSIYSDEEGEDIWAKFFEQPSGMELERIKEAAEVTVSSNLRITPGVEWLLKKIMYGDIIDLATDKYFNSRLRTYIREYQKSILIEPNRTLGVLIRGTDYTTNKPPGHAIQAAPEQVIDKIEKAKQEWKSFDWIFLATEDEEVLQKMRRKYGEKLRYIEQKRFCVQEGEYLYNLREKGEGWRIGRDYLCALAFLAKCESFIASGACNGTVFVKKINKGKFNHTYIFDLGVYE